MKSKAGDSRPRFGAGLVRALAEALRPVPLAPGEREALRERISSQIRARAPEGTQTIRAEEGRWVEVAGRVRVKVLVDDHTRGERTFLIQFLPGARYPAHVHPAEEATLVVEGELMIGDHCLRRGDVHVAAAGSWHAEVSCPKGAICFVRAAIPADDSARRKRKASTR